MSPHECSPSADNYRLMSAVNVAKLLQQSSAPFAEVGLEVHPFKIGWYNSLVAPEYCLDYHGDTLAFLVISRPSMFEKAFLPFIKSTIIGTPAPETSPVYFDPIDKCMQHYFAQFKQELSSLTDSAVDTIHDFELHMPHRRPKILLQTAAHISGAAYYYKMQTTKQRMGVCIHPLYGGWFGIRGAFIFRDLLAPDLAQKLPPDVVSQERQAELLHLFNDRWRDMTYRDIIPVQDSYSPLQMEYFALKPRDRIDFLKRTIYPMLSQCNGQPELTANGHELERQPS